MKVIKRDGSVMSFEKEKIFNAVSKANTDLPIDDKIPEEYITAITTAVVRKCEEFNTALHVEEIQDLVENEIMQHRAFSVARKYITYRYKRALVRKSNSTDEPMRYAPDPKTTTLFSFL